MLCWIWSSWQYCYIQHLWGNKGKNLCYAILQVHKGCSLCSFSALPSVNSVQLMFIWKWWVWSGISHKGFLQNGTPMANYQLIHSSWKLLTIFFPSVFLVCYSVSDSGGPQLRKGFHSPLSFSPCRKIKILIITGTHPAGPHLGHLSVSTPRKKACSVHRTSWKTTKDWERGKNR